MITLFDITVLLYFIFFFFRDLTTYLAHKVTLKDFGLGQSAQRKFLGMSEAKRVSKTVSRPLRKFALICLKAVMTAIFTEKALRFVWTCLTKSKENKYYT